MSFGIDAAMFAPPAAFLALHAIESNLVTPWVLGRRLRLAPLSVFSR
jgi:predicted PurR-regulated permease PerM